MQPELQDRLAEMIYQDAEQEAIAAQLLVDHWKNSPHRVLSIAEQQLKAEGSAIQPALLKFRYWGIRSIEFNISRIWDLLWPVTFDGVVIRLSVILLFLEYGVGTAVDAHQMRSPESSQVQVSQTQE